MQLVTKHVQEKLRKINYPPFRVGDVVRVHRRVKEGDKERIQIIEGVIIAHKHGYEPGATITLRRVTLGVGVELVLPLYSPNTEKIKIVRKQIVKRAKLYYLRKTKGKKKRFKEKIGSAKDIKDWEDKYQTVEEEPIISEPEEKIEPEMKEQEKEVEVEDKKKKEKNQSGDKEEENTKKEIKKEKKDK